MSENPNADMIAAARIIYEGTHGMTMSKLSEQTGIPLRLLKIHSRDEGWRKQLATKHGGATDDAALAAAKIKELAEVQAQADQQALPDQNALSSVNTELIIAPLPGEINELLERHRKEWSVARSLSAEAIRGRASNPMQSFEKAKLAKITAETLKLVQEGERKAYGIDKDLPPGSFVVIDRG